MFLKHLYRRIYALVLGGDRNQQFCETDDDSIGSIQSDFSKLSCSKAKSPSTSSQLKSPPSLQKKTTTVPSNLPQSPKPLSLPQKPITNMSNDDYDRKFFNQCIQMHHFDSHLTHHFDSYLTIFNRYYLCWQFGSLSQLFASRFTDFPCCRRNWPFYQSSIPHIPDHVHWWHGAWGSSWILDVYGNLVNKSWNCDAGRCRCFYQRFQNLDSASCCKGQNNPSCNQITCDGVLKV